MDEQTIDMDEQGIDQRVGVRVRQLRKACGLSQTELGDRIGVTFQQVQKYENGKNRISASKLWLIAQCLGVHASTLLAELPGPDDAALDETQRVARAWRTLPAAHRGPLLALIESIAGAGRSKRRSVADAAELDQTR